MYHERRTNGLQTLGHANCGKKECIEYWSRFASRRRSVESRKIT